MSFCTRFTWSIGTTRSPALLVDQDANVGRRNVEQHCLELLAIHQLHADVAADRDLPELIEQRLGSFGSRAAWAADGPAPTVDATTARRDEQTCQ